MTNRSEPRKGNIKLTEKQVKTIRKLAPTSTYKELATRYGLHQTTIFAIVHRKTWQHVD